MNVLAFSASNSSKSINHELIEAIIDTAKNIDVDLIRLNQYDIPMYGIDEELSNGMPVGVKDLMAKIIKADALIISVAEHNGNITAFFKNIIDWLSRISRDCLKGKKLLVLSSSPGSYGGHIALELTVKTVTQFGGEVVASNSFGNFNDIVKNSRFIDEASAKIATKMLQKLV